MEGGNTLCVCCFSQVLASVVLCVFFSVSDFSRVLSPGQPSWFLSYVDEVYGMTLHLQAGSRGNGWLGFLQLFRS